MKAAAMHFDDSDRNASGTHLTTLAKKFSGSGTRIVDIRRLDQPIILRLLAGEPLSQRKNKSYSFLAAGQLRCIVSAISRCGSSKVANRRGKNDVVAAFSALFTMTWTRRSKGWIRFESGGAEEMIVRTYRWTGGQEMSRNAQVGTSRSDQCDCLIQSDIAAPLSLATADQERYHVLLWPITDSSLPMTACAGTLPSKQLSASGTSSSPGLRDRVWGTESPIST